MNKKQLMVVVTFAVALLYHSLSLAGNGIDNALLEADSHFIYNKHPIHPGLVEEFSSWISDPGEPTTISVDVAAKHGNEYFEDNVKIEQDGSVVLQKDNGDTFYYKWLGIFINKVTSFLAFITIGAGLLAFAQFLIYSLPVFLSAPLNNPPP